METLDKGTDDRKRNNISKVTSSWTRCWDGTCLTISVLSLQGVEPASLSPSSWTIMVFTDSVSPLLSLEDLQEKRPSTHTLPANLFHPAELLETTGMMSWWNQTNIHSPGVLGARGRLFTRFLINLFVVVFISGVRFLTRGWIIRHLIRGADVVGGTQLLG